MLHGNSFGNRLAFYKPFFANGCYVFINYIVSKFNFFFGKIKVKFYAMMFLICFIYEEFKFVL